MIRRLISTTALGAFALTSSSCLKSDSTTTINGDGSGRFSMTMEMNIAGLMGMMGAAGGGAAPAELPKAPEPKDMLVDMMRSMNSTVDVWTEASAETTKMGATRIKVSGLTKDWTAMGNLSSALDTAGMGDTPVPVPTDFLKDIKTMTVTKDSGGNTVITMMGLDAVAAIFEGMRSQMVKDGSAPEPDSFSISADEIEGQMAVVREQYNSMKGVVALMLKDMKLESTITTGGTIVEAAGFTKSEDGKSATWTMNGEQVMDMLNAIMNDEEMPGKAAELVKSVMNNFSNGESTAAVRKFAAPFFEKLFNGSPNPRLVIKGDGNAFDYAAEVEKAKAAQTPELKALVEKASRKNSVKLPGSTTEEASSEEK
jgi:hypothetical protein